MKHSYRLEQINSLIQKLISDYLQKEGDFPPNYLVTVTKIETSKDLGIAKVRISSYPKINDKIKLYFQKNIFALQQALNKKLNMYPIPKIKIIYDESEEKAARIESLLNKIKIEKNGQNDEKKNLQEK